MKNELPKQKTDTVLQIMDELIDGEPWDESNFIRSIGKNLRDIREEFINDLHLGSEKSKITSHVANRIALRSGQQEVYIALYSSDGANIYAWERIVSNLPRQVISRPIYSDEEDVKAIIKTKENKINEAYVAIYISQSDILPLPIDKAPVDKLGKPMLSLKDKTLNLDNINVFVHQSGIYSYVNGRLLKKI